MTTKTCSTCETSKPADEFPKKGAQCKACIAKKAAAAYHAKRGSSAKMARPKASGNIALVIDACFGFEATVNVEGYLEIKQRDQAGEVSDTLLMSRTEFRQLVDKFSGWAAA